MGKFAYDGKTRVAFVETIADIAEPSPTEIAAGTDLSPYITKNGLSTPSNQNMVPSGALAETFDAEVPGTFGGPIELTMFRDVPDDDAWNLFTFGTEGYIVIRYGVLSATAFANGNDVEVYPIQTHEPIMTKPASNENATFKVMCAVTAQPNLHATVTT